MNTYHRFPFYRFYFIVFLVSGSQNFKAQLCNGSLGDPIVNINFGSGTALFGAALGSAATSYNYVAAAFPNDGSYTIENSTATSGNMWWSTTDRTGDAGGYDGGECEHQ